VEITIIFLLFYFIYFLIGISNIILNTCSVPQKQNQERQSAFPFRTRYISIAAAATLFKYRIVFPHLQAARQSMEIFASRYKTGFTGLVPLRIL